MITGSGGTTITGSVLIGAMKLCVLNLCLYQPCNIKFAFHFDVCTADFATFFVLVQNACKLNFMVHRIRRIVIFKNIQRTFAGMHTLFAEPCHIRNMIFNALRILSTSAFEVFVKTLISLYPCFVITHYCYPPCIHYFLLH